nr:Gag-Pol polyprotein [Tanacetum cinerariifolium]
MQTQTSNTLHNAIMEAGSKDRSPMLAHDKEVLISEGSPVKRTEMYMETYKNVSQDIRDQLNAEAEAVQIILTWIDNDIYSTVDACPNACEISQQAATRNRGKALVNSPEPIYDQEPSMVAEDDKTSKDNEIDKLMALISLSFMKIYKPTNNNLQTSSNTSRENQDNSPRINRSTGECQKPKRVKDAAYHREKMLLCKQEEAGIQLNAEQADWRDDTDDESEDQELEAHYMYMAQLQEVSLDAANSGPIFDAEPLQKVLNDDHYNVFSIESEHPEQSESIHDTYPIEQEEHNVIIDSLDMSYDREQIDQNDDDADLANECELLASLIEKLKREIDDSKNRNKFLETSNKVLIEKLKAPESEEVIRLGKESRSKLSDLIRPFDYDKLNNLYDLFVPQREKSSEQRYFSEISRLSHTTVNNGNSKESFNKQTTLLEKWMDESILWDQKCKSSIELLKLKVVLARFLMEWNVAKKQSLNELILVT